MKLQFFISLPLNYMFIFINYQKHRCSANPEEDFKVGHCVSCLLPYYENMKYMEQLLTLTHH